MIVPEEDVASGVESHPFRAILRWWRGSVVGSVDHVAVIARIVEESGWTPRYAFMILMSAGIAVLGLLLSSPAVVIGAMLISPLMNPILGLGFSLTLFDFSEMRRSLTALVIGSLLAVSFTALLVLASPLKAPTAEILARTRPNLFDLLVALFAALAGTFAIIRGRGETITGVAIATALMPPLAVVGYGLATWNVAVLGGSLALFLTNFVTIALSATIMARFYGFGRRLTAQQSWIQTGALFGVFVVMAVPLGISLARIARESFTVSQVRSLLTERFGARSRVTQLDVDFAARPIVVRSVVIAPRTAMAKTADVRVALERRLARPITLQLDQVLLGPGSTALDAQRTEIAQVKEAENSANDRIQSVTRMVALAAGVGPDKVTLDREHQRALVAAAPLPGATLATYKALEDRVRGATDDWDIEIAPPVQVLPVVSFADNADTLDADAREAVLLSAWAAHRWNAPGMAVPGLPEGPAPKHPTLAQRRALAIAELLRAQGVIPAGASAAGQRFRLSPATP